MTTEPLFHAMDSMAVAKLIRTAKNSVFYASPGIQIEPARAMAEVAKRLGPEILIVCIDFEEGVFRLGYGDIEAVKCLRDGRIVTRNVPGLRIAFVIVDDQGFIFTPTALYLEEEPNGLAPNGMRLTRQLVIETLARFSPAAKAIALAQTTTLEETDRITALPVEVGASPITEAKFVKVNASLKEAPPVKFDVARQVRVFEPYLQYVELILAGAAIQRRRLAIPPSIQKLGGKKDIERRLHTTFDLIEKSGKLSSKGLEDDLNKIRKDYTKSLGKNHGRVILKAQKPRLEELLAVFQKKLHAHQQTIKAELQQHLNNSRTQIIDYYLARVIDSPPDALRGQLLHAAPNENDARKWLDVELDRVFSSAESLIQDMRLEVRFKDVTFETLNRPDFLASIKEAFPTVDWDRAYEEFSAAGEAKNSNEEAQ